MNLYSALVFDAKQSNGWISVDQYFLGAKPAMRSPEIGGNNLKIAVGALIYDYAGSDDTSGNVISCRCVTRQDDQQDARGEKLYGDLMFDADPGGSAGTGVGVDLIVLADYGTTTVNTQLFTAAGRSQTPVDLSTTGLGYLSRTFGLDVQWTGSGAPTTLYQYVYSYVPKPEILQSSCARQDRRRILGRKVPARVLYRVQYVQPGEDDQCPSRRRQAGKPAHCDDRVYGQHGVEYTA